MPRLWNPPLKLNEWLSGGGWSYIFRTLNSIPFFPDKSRYHRIFTLSGLFRTCQAPDPAAEVDPIAHFGHFRSHLASSYMHVVANKLENSCHRWIRMSLCYRFDFGTSKHPSMFYLSNHSAAKLTLNMRRNFRQPKHRRVRVRSPPSWIWIRDDKLTLVKSGCAKMFGELLSHIVVFDL